MPSNEISSRRPTNGEMNVAPALAASRACIGVKHSVTLTIVPFSDSSLQTFRPAGGSGTLTAMFGAISESFRPSARMVS